MRIMTAAFALGTALVLCNLGTFSGVAQARTAKVVREPPRERLIVTVPVVRPYWDSYIVPRYRYRPEDDRIDPYGPPVVPVIRYGNQEVTLPAWFWEGRRDTTAHRDLALWRRTALGPKRKCPGPRGTSVLPSGADIVSLPQHVRLVPTHKVAALQPAAREQEPRGR